METKEFRFIKNMLWPFKTTIVVGPEGITNKNKLVRWQDITTFSYGIQVINRALNYVIAYDDKDGKGHILNYMHSIVGSKKKKAMMAELYEMIHEGFTAHHIAPKVKELADKVRAGETVTVGGCDISQQGVSVTRKKEKVLIQARDVQLESRKNSGGFDIVSAQNKKLGTYVPFRGVADSRHLLALLNELYPDRALDVY